MPLAKPYLRSLQLDLEKTIDYDTYPFSIPAVAELGQIDFQTDVTFLVGENGSDKSTLLEVIAIA
ncbi:MAG: hypothetical protein NWQ13_00465 [Glaciimonas sp.]|nr:hypothetical protein [Glaciimonas sp.]